jgi:hypothetical protein
MALVLVDVTELRRRLGVDVAGVPDSVLSACLDVASAIADPRCDPDKVAAYPGAYAEGVYQLAVKVYDTQTKGAVNISPDGFPMAAPMQATSGLPRSVYGVLGPVLRNGGLGFA